MSTLTYPPQQSGPMPGPPQQQPGPGTPGGPQQGQQVSNTINFNLAYFTIPFIVFFHQPCSQS